MIPVAILLLQTGGIADLTALVFAIAGGLFVLGAATALFRRDPLLRVMGVVMVFAAAALNLVAASGLRGIHGQAFAIFLAVECAALSVMAVAVLAARNQSGKDGRS